MKQEIIKVFCCDYCSKISKSAGAISLHERRCRKNPHTHALCYKCVHYNQAKIEDLEDINVTVGEGDVQTFVMTPNRCEKQQIKVFNGLKWNKATLEMFLRQGTYKMMPSIADGCPYFEAYQEPPQPTAEEIELQRQKEAHARLLNPKNITDIYYI